MLYEISHYVAGLWCRYNVRTPDSKEHMPDVKDVDSSVALQVHRWNCEACGTGYELGAIESALVAVVQQQERAYQLQDLRCIKCKNVSTSLWLSESAFEVMCAVGLLAAVCMMTKDQHWTPRLMACCLKTPPWSNLQP